jgi:hypothetical protein
MIKSFRHPFRVQFNFAIAFRAYRFAQPPANFCKPFGRGSAAIVELMNGRKPRWVVDEKVYCAANLRAKVK